MDRLRQQIRAEVESIQTMDDLEGSTKADVLAWIDSGAQLCRTEKPATPDMHLVSYFPLIDNDYILLVEHINAGLWLPNGGHVEPGEHPRDTAIREVSEELNVAAHFLMDAPVFLTSTVTVGLTAGHTDVSIWYALKGDRCQNYVFDATEFSSVRWFHNSELSSIKTDPELARFMKKFLPLSRDKSAPLTR